MFEFVCEVCGKLQSRKRPPKSSICKSCKTKQTNLKKYGVENVFQSPIIQERIKQTNLERYGVENVFQSPTIQKRIKQTNIERYGTDNLFKNQEIQKEIRKERLEKYGSESPLASQQSKIKFQNTCLERFGTTNPLSSKEIQERIKQTNIERYGFETARQNKKINSKIESTNLERYGTTCVFQNEEIKSKIKQTNLEKYGVDHFSKTKECRQKASCRWKLLWSDLGKLRNKDWGEIHRKSHKKYSHDELSFDSSWELAYFIYLVDHNSNFEYQCDPIEYQDSDGTKHFYIPDFKVGNELIEIKGDQFFTEDGKFVNPYDRSEKADSHNQSKFNCMVEHKVKILKKEELKPILEYVETTYGKDFLSSCRKPSKKNQTQKPPIISS